MFQKSQKKNYDRSRNRQARSRIFQIFKRKEGRKPKNWSGSFQGLLRKRQIQFAEKDHQLSPRLNPLSPRASSLEKS